MITRWSQLEIFWQDIRTTRSRIINLINLGSYDNLVEKILKHEDGGALIISCEDNSPYSKNLDLMGDIESFDMAILAFMISSALEIPVK